MFEAIAVLFLATTGEPVALDTGYVSRRSYGTGYRARAKRYRKVGIGKVKGKVFRKR